MVLCHTYMALFSPTLHLAKSTLFSWGVCKSWEAGPQPLSLHWKCKVRIPPPPNQQQLLFVLLTVIAFGIFIIICQQVADILRFKGTSMLLSLSWDLPRRKWHWPGLKYRPPHPQRLAEMLAQLKEGLCSKTWLPLVALNETGALPLEDCRVQEWWSRSLAPPRRKGKGRRVSFSRCLTELLTFTSGKSLSIRMHFWKTSSSLTKALFY